MTHEPECPYSGPADLCPTCSAIRAAYQRGRDDAAEAVGDLRGDMSEPSGSAWCNGYNEGILHAVAAARGDVRHG